MRVRAPLLAAGALAGLAVVLASLLDHPRTEPLDPSAGAAGMDRVADRLHVAHAGAGRLFAIEDHFLYVSEDTGHTFRRLGSFPKPRELSPMERIRETVARSGLSRHFRRYSGPRSMTVLGSGTILVFYDHVYRSDDGGTTFRAVDGTGEDVLPQPFPSSVGVAVGPGDTVYYGEYVTSARPHEVRIIRGTEDGRRWSVAHTFPAGEIFHIHSITYDPYRKRYWIASGDREEEVRLMYTEDDFASFRTVGCCEQKWRLVDLIVTEDALVWGSDDDESQPHIYRYELATEEVTTLARLDNPSYHAAMTADGGMAITTTFEPQSRYTREKGPPAATSLWRSADGVSWSRVLTLKGDSARWSQGLRPQIQLPSGDPLPALFATPWHTEDWDFASLRFRVGVPGEAPVPAGAR